MTNRNDPVVAAVTKEILLSFEGVGKWWHDHGLEGSHLKSVPEVSPQALTQLETYRALLEEARAQFDRLPPSVPELVEGRAMLRVVIAKRIEGLTKIEEAFKTRDFAAFMAAYEVLMESQKMLEAGKGLIDWSRA